MTDLDTLRPEVRRADSFLDSMACTADEEAAVKTIRAELRRLAGIESELANVERGYEKWKRSAESVGAELAALKARIAEAPLEVVESLPGAVGPPWPMDHWIEVRMADPCACVGQGLIGKRVRLVVEE